MAHPETWLEATYYANEAQHAVSSQIINPSFIPRSWFTNPTPPSPPLKIQKLTMVEMVECQLKGLFYNCHEKYFMGHKCKEKKLYMVISKDISEEDGDVSPPEVMPHADDHSPPSDPPEVEPLISLNYLTSISTPQTLKLIGYLKNQKFIILVDSGSTHNFIHR
jgi:hypothetical protein